MFNFILPMSFFGNSVNSKLLNINLNTGKVTELLDFFPEKSLQVSNKGFTRIDWHSFQKLYYIAGFNFILKVSPHNWKIIDIWNFPDWNDIHDIKIFGNLIYIANTGKESIDIISDKGIYLNSFDFHPLWINEKRFNGMQIDIEALKLNNDLTIKANRPSLEAQLVEPYFSESGKELPFLGKKLIDCYHINHICKTKYQTLVTLFMQKQIFDLNSMEVVITNLKSHPHDGFIFQDEFWITCVDGNIFCYKIINRLVTNELKYHYDIFALTGHTGWCRGLWVTRDYLIIGLTQIQVGKMPESRWSGYPVEKTETSILLFDRKTEKLLSFVDLSCKEGSKVFGFYPEVTDE